MVPRMYTIGLFCLCDIYLHRYLHTCVWVWGVGVCISGHRRYLLCGCRGVWYVMLHRRCVFYGSRGLWYAMREWVDGVGVETRACTSTDFGAIHYVAAAAYDVPCFIGAVCCTAAAGYGL